MAKKFGVSFTEISSIQKNKVFKDVLQNTPILVHGKNGWFNNGYKNRTGPNNNWAKFSEEQILDIRKRYKNGEMITVLADNFNCCRQTISKIVNYFSYKNIK